MSVPFNMQSYGDMKEANSFKLIALPGGDELQQMEVQ